MGKNVIQIPSDDGCVYVYDLDANKLKKVCDIFSERDVPDNVRDILLKLDRRVNYSRQ
jgi:hypothetical protein